MAYSIGPPVCPPRSAMNPSAYSSTHLDGPCCLPPWLDSPLEFNVILQLGSATEDAVPQKKGDLLSQPHRISIYFYISFSALSSQAYLKLLKPPHLLYLSLPFYSLHIYIYRYRCIYCVICNEWSVNNYYWNKFILCALTRTVKESGNVWQIASNESTIPLNLFFNKFWHYRKSCVCLWFWHYMLMSIEFSVIRYKHIIV